MTEKELAAIAQAMAPIVREHVTQALADADKRIAVLETQLKAVSDVRDKVLTLEGKSSVVVPPVASGPTTAEIELLIRDRLEPVTKEVAEVRATIGVLEVRAAVPGPAGKDGQDGQPGPAGADGLGFDDVAVDFDGDRTIAVKFVRGDRVKSFPITLPYLKYQGVFTEGKSYQPGDTVTWGGSQWYCNEETVMKPGDGAKAWTLCVKKGRDGRDGTNGRDATVVKVN